VFGFAGSPELPEHLVLHRPAEIVHTGADTLKAGSRSCSGSSIEGSVLKNSAPAASR
jgi:hypothetical protein